MSISRQAPRGIKASRVIDLRSLKHGDRVELRTYTAPQKVIVTGTVDGSPWTSSGEGEVDMIRIDGIYRGKRCEKDYSLKDRVIYTI